MGKVIQFPSRVDNSVEELKRGIIEAIDRGDKLIVAIDKDGEIGTGWANCESADIFELMSHIQVDAIRDCILDLGD